MSLQTWLTYNGVSLRNVLTRRFSQEVVYDASDTDKMYDRYIINVVGYVAPLTSGTGIWADPSSPLFGINNATDAEKALRLLLMTPRGNFQFVTGANVSINPNGTLNIVHGGWTLLECGPMQFGSQNINLRDVTNGPKPRRCDITRITGGQVFEVEFEIEINMLSCYIDGQASLEHAGVLSNRWSCVDDIDGDFNTTRTISGRLVTVNGTINPHTLRNWVVPRLQPGFKRERMSFRATEDGLQLEYTIVDREAHFAAPAPATSWHVQHTESIGDGRMPETACSVTVAAPRNVGHTSLVALVAAVLRAKTWKDLDVKHYQLEDLSITDVSGDDRNYVTGAVKLRRLGGPNNDPKQMIGLMADSLGTPITANDLQAAAAALPVSVANYDSNLAKGANTGDPVYVVGPIPITAAWSATLQTPCTSQIRAVESASTPSADPEAGGGEVAQVAVAAVVVDQLPPDPPNNYSQDHKGSLYTHYQVNSKYLVDEQVVHLPIAGGAAVQSQSSSSSSGGSGGSGGSGSTGQTGTSVANILGNAMKFTLSSGIARRIVRIQAQRIGAEPKVPTPEETVTLFGNTAENGAAWLLRWAVNALLPEREPNGAMRYGVQAEYEYGLQRVIPHHDRRFPSDFFPFPGVGVLSQPLADFLEGRIALQLHLRHRVHGRIAKFSQINR